MKLLERVSSKVDNVVKYVFQFNEKNIVEFSYIDNGTGKDIICVSCQTMCNMGCKFCHCTDYIQTLKVFSLSSSDILQGVNAICSDLSTKKDTLLISYMGCGEPFNLLFKDTLVGSMRIIDQEYKDVYKTVRFGVATCLPKAHVSRFFEFCSDIRNLNLPVKLHLSLHYTNNEIRKEWMPNSLDIQSSIAACKFYKEYTGNSVEIHYTLIDGVNDTAMDAQRLSLFAYRNDFNVKLITYNEKETIDYKKSSRLEKFNNNLDCSSEIYTPPGRDVGSSCGQFLFETHMKYAEAK
jgi:adenine C2-methylase RlmN of 23S rRNA A2503 and tRNA A37